MVDLNLWLSWVLFGCYIGLFVCELFGVYGFSFTIGVVFSFVCLDCCLVWDLSLDVWLLFGV